MTDKQTLAQLKKRLRCLVLFNWLVFLAVSCYCFIIFIVYHILIVETIVFWSALAVFSILITIYKSNCYRRILADLSDYQQKETDNAKRINDYVKGFEAMTNFINSQSNIWQCLEESYRNNEVFYKKLQKLNIILKEKIDTKTPVELINFFIELFKDFYDYYQACKELHKLDSVRLIKRNICPLCIINEIIQEFASHTRDYVQRSVNSVLNNFNALKSDFESTNSFLLESIKEFTAGKKLAEESYLQNMDVTNIFYQKINKIKENFMESLKYYFQEFDAIFKLISNIKEIFEKIKILALNLNIEASKTQHKVFMVISKEFQKLVLKIEEFNNQILTASEKSLKQIESEKSNKEKDLNSFAEFIEYAFEVQKKYDEDNKKHKEVFDRIINYILKIQDKNKINIFSLFKNMQELNIALEVIVHLFEIQNTNLINKTNNLHSEIGGKIGLCTTPEEKQETYKEILASIKTLVTTRIERNIVKELNKKYLNEENSLLEEKTEDVIIF